MHGFPIRSQGTGSPMRTIHGDHTLALMREGYALLPNRRAQLGEDVFRLRVLGQSAVAMCGTEPARTFYDDSKFVRSTAIPEPVRHTLIGDGAVHTLDDATHRHRKQMFLTLREPTRIRTLVEHMRAEWDATERLWTDRRHMCVFHDTAEVLVRGVTDWAGIPLTDLTAPAAVRDMLSMVDGFGNPGGAHWRGRLARGRAERRLARTARRVRVGQEAAGCGSMLEHILSHRDERGELLGPRLVAVELLNVLRPTVAIAWFMAFAAHAMHRWPQHVERLRADDAFTESFAHEIRRFYPFAPFMGARARRDLPWDGDVIRRGTLVLLDLFGNNHDPRLWEDPYTFRPDRFIGHPPGQFDLVPQGGGDPATGHRCPGEDMVVEVLKALIPRLARLRYDVPEQDLTIPLSRMPTRPRSGVVLTDVRPG